VIGSAFPKAKAKHGLFKVTRQALLRFLFLPIYHVWWTEQSTPRLFTVFLTLYLAQIFIVILHLNLIPSWLLYTFVNNGTATSWNTTAATVTPRPFGPSNSHLPDSGDILISDIQTSEILSPIFLMIVLTILHSQIVATYGSKSDDSRSVRSKRYKHRSNSGSTSHGKLRSKRRQPRHSQSHRRRSNAKNAQATLSREGSQESSFPSPVSKKVFFAESKSWTSSNSDKDEGIVDGHENQESGENEPEGISCGRRLSKEIRSIVEKNIIEANLNATINKFAEEEALAIQQQAEVVTPLQTKEELEDASPSSAIKDGFSLDPTYSLRSNLRKRNVSKASEISTSCADCSSNNNESSTEDEYREATMEDEEMRSKSEWTAVTTNSEDDYDDDNINSEDEMTETQLHDHPFAWEFQKVF
jgi:hypothetical protein